MREGLETPQRAPGARQPGRAASGEAGGLALHTCCCRAPLSYVRRPIAGTPACGQPSCRHFLMF